MGTQQNDAAQLTSCFVSSWPPLWRFVNPYARPKTSPKTMNGIIVSRAMNTILRTDHSVGCGAQALLCMHHDDHDQLTCMMDPMCAACAFVCEANVRLDAYRDGMRKAEQHGWCSRCAPHAGHSDTDHAHLLTGP